MTNSTDRAKARRERVQALAREDILEAALRAFARAGYGETKIADIAAEAGFTAASLYTYFPGKKEIFVAAADHFVAGLEGAFGELPAAPHEDFEAFAEDARARIRNICQYGDERSEVLAFLMRLRWSGEPVLQEIRSRGVPPCVAGTPEASDCEAGEHGPFRLQAYFARAWQALGVERFGVDAGLFSTMVSGIIESFFVQHYIFRMRGPLLASADAIADLLLFGLRGRR